MQDAYVCAYIQSDEATRIPGIFEPRSGSISKPWVGPENLFDEPTHGQIVIISEPIYRFDHGSTIMKAKYDFSKARRGAVLPAAGNKVRITIRLDRDIIEWFKSKVEAAGGGNYQTMLNEALRQYITRRDEPLERILRRVVREELHTSR